MGWRVGCGRDRKKGEAVGHKREKRSEDAQEWRNVCRYKNAK